MRIIEDVVSKTREYDNTDTSDVYGEIRDLLNNKIGFSSLEEVNYTNDVEEGVVRAKIEGKDFYDKYFIAENDIYLEIKPEKVKITVKGKLVGNYPTDGWKDNLFYYGYVSLLHKFLVSKNQGQYEDWVQGKINNLFDNIEPVFQ